MPYLYFYKSKIFPAAVAGAILKTAKAKSVVYEKYAYKTVNIQLMNQKTHFIVMIIIYHSIHSVYAEYKISIYTNCL